MQFSLYEGHWVLLMISQHWFRYWLGAVRQQAITWTNVDPDLSRHMASLGHNELKAIELNFDYYHYSAVTHVIWITRLFVQQLVWANIKKKNIKVLHYCPSVRGIYLWLVDSLHKGSAIWKVFPCHDFFMFSEKALQENDLPPSLPLSWWPGKKLISSWFHGA